MAIYESVIVLRGDLTPQQAAEQLEGFKEILAAQGAKLIKEESWGLRPLAYKIKKNKKGHYALFEMEAGVEAVREFKRKLGLSENAIRFIIVRREEKSTEPSAILHEREDRDARK